MSLNRENYEQLLSFARTSLQTFIDIERENADYRRTIRALQNRDSDERSSRRLVTWLAHDNESFVEGMRQIEERIHIDLQIIVFTGGEVLDHLSRSEPDLLILGDDFPDIPAEFVLDSVRSQADRCAIVRIEGWNQGDRLGTLSGPYDEPSISRPLETANDLLVLFNEARARFELLEMSSDFARSFRERHQSWMQEYKNVATILEAILEKQS